MRIELYFSDYYGVDESTVEKQGAFKISVVSDLPPFIDSRSCYSIARSPNTKNYMSRS